MTPETIVACEGDSIPSLAYEAGLLSDTVWNDPHNAKLKQLRKNPNQLKEGDLVYLREIQPREESRAADAQHKFKKKGCPAKLRIQINLLDEPWRDEQYTLIAGDLIKNGMTDADAMIEASVPPNLKSAQVLLQGGKLTIQLNNGKLNPPDTISGMKQRLNNLGFLCPNEDDTPDDDFKAELARFQVKYHLEETGEPDGPTKAKLEEVHP